MSTLPAQPNHSLMDGLLVLQALARSAQPLSCSTLAQQLGLHLTRVNRLVKTLAYLGLAHRTASSKYTAGPAMHVLAAQSLFGSGLLSCAGSTLESLTQYGYTVAMGMRWRDHVSYLFHWSPGISIAEAVGRVALFPTTRSSIGLALLARQSPVDIQELYAPGAIPGFTDSAALTATLACIRADGYADIPTEDLPETRNIAVTLGAPAYAALALVGVESTRVTKMVSTLHAAARVIAANYEQRTKG